MVEQINKTHLTSKKKDLAHLLQSLADKVKSHQVDQNSGWMENTLGKLVREPINKSLKRPLMSAQGLFYKPINDVNSGEMCMVPLKAVDITATLEGALATVDFNMSYVNPGASPIECTYEFPLEVTTILSKLIVKVDDKIIEAVVKAKEEAK